MPGRSNAFAISEKLGLKKEIIDKAATHLTSDSIAFEEILSQIEKKPPRLRNASATRPWRTAPPQRRCSQRAAEAAGKCRRIERELEQVRARPADRRGRKGAGAGGARRAGRPCPGKRQADFKERLQGFRQGARRTLRELEDELDPVRETQTEYELPRPLRVGDTVEVVGITRAGVVASLPGATGN